MMSNTIALGRRKSWILPIQCMAGVLLIVMSHYVNSWFYDGPITSSKLTLITMSFFTIVLLMATQDVRCRSLFSLLFIY